MRKAVEETGKIAVVGEAGDGCEGVRMVRRLRPDLVVLDGHMPCRTGWEAATLLRATYPRLLIFMFTADTPPGSVDVDSVHHKVYGIRPLVQDLLGRLGVAPEARADGGGPGPRPAPARPAPECDDRRT